MQNLEQFPYNAELARMSDVGELPDWRRRMYIASGACATRGKVEKHLRMRMRSLRESGDLAVMVKAAPLA